MRLMKLCVIMWSLGLSHRSVALILSAFGVQLSHMSAWRDLQEAGQTIRRKLQWKSARIVGVDGAWVSGKGIMVAVDMGDGELLALAEIDEKDKEAVAAWLKLLKQKQKIGAVVTDDLATYKEIADDLELGHQVCQFHVRRWVGKRLYDLWKKMSGKTSQPEEKHTPLEKLHDLILRLSRDWERYIEFYSDPGVPWTNNRTEQVIGRLKSRAKRVRGYQSRNADGQRGCRSVLDIKSLERLIAMCNMRYS